jgi:hypothetical protein
MLTLLLSFCKCEFSRVCSKILADYSFIKLCFLAFIHSCLVIPYSNQRRHNPLSIPHTPYQTLIIFCPNFDLIYQVIILENFNEWNLSLEKRRIIWKKEQGLKNKRGKTSFEKLHVSKGENKKRTRFTSCWERFYWNKIRKEITLSYSAKSDIWPHSYPRIICICSIFIFLTFSFFTPIYYTILHQQWLFAIQTL